MINIATPTKRLSWVALAAVACLGAAHAQDGSLTRYMTVKTRALQKGPYKMGYQPSSVEDFQAAAKVVRKTRNAGAPPAAIPDKVDLRDDGYLPAIGLQEKSDCVAWSTAYYAYTYMVRKNRRSGDEEKQNPMFVFSPQYLYPHINEGKDAGATISNAMAWIEKHGCATLQEAPYNPKDFSTQPSETAEARAGRYKARKTVCLASFRGNGFDPQLVKEWIAKTRTPVVTAIALFRDFPGYEKAPNTAVTEDFVYNLTIDPKDNWVGNHAMTIVGYDNAKKAFLFANSWSTDWGAKGYLWISEDYLKRATGETWGFVPGGFVARGLRGVIPIGDTLEVVPGKVK